MKTIAAKSDARFLLIPPLLNSTSETVTNNQFQDDSFGEDGKLLGKILNITYTFIQLLVCLFHITSVFI